MGDSRVTWDAFYLPAMVLLLLALGVFIVLFSKFDYSGMVVKLGKVGFFLASFLSSLIFLTFPSEPLVVLSTKIFDPASILVLATVGSTLAALVNYYVGLRGIRTAFNLFKRNKAEELKAEKWFRKWGSVILFFSPSIPFLGDAFTVAAGALKTDLKKFVFFILLGRAVKTILLVYFGEFLFGLA